MCFWRLLPQHYSGWCNWRLKRPELSSLQDIHARFILAHERKNIRIGCICKGLLLCSIPLQQMRSWSITISTLLCYFFLITRPRFDQLISLSILDLLSFRQAALDVLLCSKLGRIWVVPFNGFSSSAVLTEFFAPLVSNARTVTGCVLSCSYSRAKMVCKAVFT